MFSKSVLLLVVICLIQGSICETAEDVTAEYKPKISKLQSSVRLAITTGETRLEATRLKISNNIVKGQQAIAEAVNALKDAVNEEVETNPKDITHCVQKFIESVGTVNPGALGNCSSESDFLESRKQISGLWNAYGTTFSIVGDCVTEFPNDNQVNDLRKCLDGRIAEVASNVTNSQIMLNTLLDTIVINTDICIKNGVEAANVELTNLARKFEECVQSV